MQGVCAVNIIHIYATILSGSQDIMHFFGLVSLGARAYGNQ